MRALALFCLGILSACSSLRLDPEPVRRPEPVLARGWSFVEQEREFLEQEAGVSQVAFSAPVIADEKLIFGSDRFGLTVLARGNGRILWQKKFQDGVSGQPLAADKKAVFVGTDSGDVHAFALNSGRELWKASPGMPVHGSPILAFNRLYIGTADEALHALDPVTGKILWTYRRPAFAGTSIKGGGNPAPIAGKIWLGFSDGTLVSLNPDSGAVEFERQYRDNLKFSDLDARVVGWRDGLLVSTYDGKLRYLRRDGSSVWEFPSGGARAPLLTEGEIVFFPSSDGNIYAISGVSGKELWRYSLPRGVPTSLALAEKSGKKVLLATASEERVIVLDPQTGRLIDAANLGRGSGSFAPIAVDNETGSFYVLSLFSRIHSFHLNL